MATLAQRLQAEIDRANLVTSHADITVHDVIGTLIDGYGKGSIPVNLEWHQCPAAVRSYLENVSYDSMDYTVSQIDSYAPAIPAKSNYKPVEAVVDGLVFASEVPDAEHKYIGQTQYGTIKPIDRLRWINTHKAPNVRDLGGWDCDGGAVKYGLLFRGGEVTADDRDVLVGECGIRHELNLRGAGEVTWTESPLGEDVHFTRADKYIWPGSNALSDAETWKTYLRCVFNAVKYNEPLLFHCSAGADRTGAVACILEALLGMSQSDIDKDYELTCFYTGTSTGNTARRRNESEWQGLINAVHVQQGDTFRDKAVRFVCDLGFTIGEVNAFRKNMINGTPAVLPSPYGTFSITNNLTNATNNSNVVQVDEKSGYTASIAANEGYVLESVTVTMGGVDITSTVYSNGVITIGEVTGDVVIIALAEKSAEPVVNIWQTPYKLNSRLNTSETDPGADGVFISAWYPISQEQLGGDIVLRSNKNIFNHANLSGSGDYLRFYSSTTAGTALLSDTVGQSSIFTKAYDSENGIYSLTIKHTWFGAKASEIKHFRWCAKVSTSAITADYFDGCIMTINQEITG